MFVRSLWLLLLASGVFGQQFAFVPVGDSHQAIVGGALQDHLGRLWIRTAKDLECFDGTRSFSLLDYGLPPLTIPNGSLTSTIAEDSDGGIWFVWNAALYRFAGGRAELVSNRLASAVISLGPGLLLAAFSAKAPGQRTQASLYRVRKVEKAWRVERLPGLAMRGDGFLTVDHRGTALYPCAGAWCELSADAVAAWQPGLPLAALRHADVYPGVELIRRDRFGCLWFRSIAGAQYQCPADLQPRPLPLEVASNGINLLEAPDGSIVIPSYLGVAIGRPGAFRIIHPLNGLSLPMTPCAVTLDGSIWFGGPKGLIRLAYPFLLEFWTEREGVSAPFAILRMDHHVFASSGLGISLLSDDRDRWLPLKGSAGLGVIRSMIRGPRNTILVVPQHNGIVELALDGRVLARSTPGQGSQAMAIVRSGDQFWLAGDGVSRVTVESKRLNISPEPLPGVHALGSTSNFNLPRIGHGLATSPGWQWNRPTIGLSYQKRRASSKRAVRSPHWPMAMFGLATTLFVPSRVFIPPMPGVSSFANIGITMK